jgi:hypothetical protein
LVYFLIVSKVLEHDGWSARYARRSVRKVGRDARGYLRGEHTIQGPGA